MGDGELFGLTPLTTVRDSLYDLIPLPDEAAQLMATPEFLRLDGIQQLGFVSRVWPGARHTRFEHSLGVMHLMREALVRLAGRGAPIDPVAARVAVAAALLHDIGHYPFSHAIEELGPPIRSHEEIGRELILNGEISSILQNAWKVDPRRVARLIDPASEEIPAADRLAMRLLSGTLDVDKLDYLPRDARACSVPYGGVDSTRLLDSLAVVHVGGETTIGIDHKGVSPLHSLTNARQEMFDNVYWHHTNRACMVMLLRAVQDAVLAGLAPAELTSHTDASLLARLSEPDMPETTRALVRGLQARRLYKRAIEISYRSPELHTYLSALFYDPAGRRQLEMHMAAQLQRETGLASGEADILIDIPKPEKWRTEVWVQFERPPVGFSRLMSWQDVTGTNDVTLRTYEEHRRLIRIVTAEPLREAVSERWERLLLPLMAGS